MTCVEHSNEDIYWNNNSFVGQGFVILGFNLFTDESNLLPLHVHIELKLCHITKYTFIVNNIVNNNNNKNYEV